ncbi:hypothetical protein [Trinickia mobilis]|uniref:hypothetical protein n=1 Tax=Trinickia mobilis TaxID=2816356 RepID=UPI001A8DF0B3|nr:hypothetical protein [Trinickia mobilis]
MLGTADTAIEMSRACNSTTLICFLRFLRGAIAASRYGGSVGREEIIKREKAITKAKNDG